MSARILIYDSSPRDGRALAEDIRFAIGELIGAVEYSVHDPAETYTEPIPEESLAAFFVLSDRPAAEAARTFRKSSMDIPLVIVGGGEYGVLSWELGACHYLTRPVGREKLRQAIKKCIQIRINGCKRMGSGGIRYEQA